MISRCQDSKGLGSFLMDLSILKFFQVIRSKKFGSFYHLNLGLWFVQNIDVWRNKNETLRGRRRISWPYFLAIVSALRFGLFSLTSLTFSLSCFAKPRCLHFSGNSIFNLSKNSMFFFALAFAFGASLSVLWYDALSYLKNTEWK